jgi:tight adherence protein C
MIILLILGLLLTGFAVALVATAIGSQAPARAHELGGRIGKYGFTGTEEDDEAGAGVRQRFDSAASRLGAVFEKRSGSRGTEQTRAMLIAAGLYNITPGRFMGYRILCTIGAPLLWIWLAITAGIQPGLAVLGTAVIGLLGWVLPGRMIRERARQRLEKIDYELPELIDLLVVTVEAGLGFVGSMQMAAGRVSGALGQELRLTLQEQSMGLSIQEAMMNMLGRCDTPSMRSFVRSIVQGETLGVSIGQIMRDLAQEMRRRRRAVAQERAQKAPVKILFPLVLLIFPAMFVVLLGPALFLFLEAFGG